jgi:site-specific DNA recombinase
MAEDVTRVYHMVKAGIYCRISRDWEGKGLGVKRQEDECRKIAERLGWQVIDVYVDNNQSVSKYARKKRGSKSDYSRLLADIESKRIEAVILWMDDRFQRDLVPLEEFFQACDKVGLTRMASAGGELDISNPDQRMTLRIRVAIAAGDSDKQSARIRSKQQQAAEQGRQHWGREPSLW